MVVGLIGCNQNQPVGNTPAPSIKVSSIPADLKNAEALFTKHCAACHGARAAGTSHGPSFLSNIYQPSHHGDEAFVRAATIGVRAHHWSFGDMPPVNGITPQEIETIIPYVRWLQRQAGIQ